MAQDFMEHPVVWVVIALIFAGIFGSIGFVIMGSMEEAVEEAGVIYQTSECVVYNVTGMCDSEEDPDCGLEDSDYVSQVNFTEWTEYNCTYPSSAFYWRPDDPEEYTCDCGCEDSVYMLLVEYEAELLEWSDYCYINYSYQTENWTLNTSHTCDCGCDYEDGPWVMGVDIYDFDPEDPENESLWEYNFTICFNQIEGFYEIDYDEEAELFGISSLCNLSARWNVTEPCEFVNCTGWNMTYEECVGDEGCACDEDDGWFAFQTIVDIYICTDWNETSEECEAWDNETICVDEDYVWFFFQYPGQPYWYYDVAWFYSFEADEPGNLSVYTECSGEEGGGWIEEVICFNETNYWDEWGEWPPAEFWFYSNCSETNYTVIAYDTYTNDSDTYTFTGESGNGTWSASYSSVVAGIGTGFGMYGLIPLMTVVGVVIALLISAFVIKRYND